MTDPNPEDPNTWLYYTNEAIRKMIDAALETMAKLESQKGADSTTEEKAEINKKMNICLSLIKDFDINFWLRLCPTKNEEVVK